MSYQISSIDRLTLTSLDRIFGTMLNELEQLKRIRLERDLPYRRLALEVGVSTATLFRLLGPDPRGAQARTIFKIQKYVEQFEAEKAADCVS